MGVFQVMAGFSSPRFVRLGEGVFQVMASFSPPRFVRLGEGGGRGCFR